MKTVEQYQKDIEEIILWSQQYPFDLNCKEIAEQWYLKKKKFIDLFQGTKYCSKDLIDFHLSDFDKEGYFDEFMDKIFNYGWNKYSYNGTNLDDFFYNNKKTFFTNKVMSPPPQVENEKSKIKKNDKLGKSLKFFFYDKKELRACQDLMSEYIQKNKIKGYVYLSVDPIDFLLASENNENWRSCHALDGEYRVGNLSYLLDETTVIAYISSEKEEHMRMMPKNMVAASKKNRMYIHMNDNIVYYNKMYPFDLPTFKSYITKTINELIEEEDYNCYLEPKDYNFSKVMNSKGDTHILDESYVYLWGQIRPLSEMIHRPNYSLNYLDLISAHHPVYVSIRKNIYWNSSDIREIFNIKIGEEVPCACGCGNITTEENNFICHKCQKEVGMDGDYFEHCVDCGQRLFEEDIFYSDRGSFYCERCFDDYSYDLDDDNWYD